MSATRSRSRSAARLAAVQALYQMDLGGATLPEVLAEFASYRLGKEVDGEQYRDADAAFFRDLVTGVVRDQRELDPAIHAVLVADWPLPRIDITLRAILRSGAYELKCRPDVPARVVIRACTGAGARHSGTMHARSSVASEPFMSVAPGRPKPLTAPVGGASGASSGGVSS